jgi:ATP synthase protein I
MGQAASVGAMLAFCIFVGTGLGVLLDRWLGTRPWLTLVLMFFGIVAGFYNVVRMVSSLGQGGRQP